MDVDAIRLADSDGPFRKIPFALGHGHIACPSFVWISIASIQDCGVWLGMVSCTVTRLVGADLCGPIDAERQSTFIFYIWMETTGYCGITLGGP